MQTGGLANIGNTCSINTLLQCLAHCPSFADYIINTPIDTINVKNSKYILYNEIKSIFIQILIDKNSVIPRRFIHAFREAIGSSYIAGEELDFTEMWMLMLDRINEETKNKAGSIFNGSQIQQIECNNCSRMYHNKEDITLHYIHITDSDVVTSFKNMLSKELIQEWKCDKCNCYSGMKTIHLSVLPKVLVLVLQRCSTREKIRLPINISNTIIISPPKITYKLKSIANHYGTQDSGHYTAVCIDNEGTWHEYNDLKIYEASSTTLINNKEAYALFYERD